jgi:hypothetical protein
MSITTYHQNGMEPIDQYLVTPNSAEAITTSSHKTLLFNENSFNECNLTILRRLTGSRNLKWPRLPYVSKASFCPGWASKTAPST